VAIDIKTPYSIRLGIVGAGTMGSGIALTALLANMVVTLYDISPEMLEKAKGYITSHLNRKDKQTNIKNLTLTQKLEELRGAGVVIEAIPEKIGLKKELFECLDDICPAPTILATNTSTLPVTAIASMVKKPGRVGGMHFFNPAPVMPLVEVIRGAQTEPGTVKSLVSLAEILGKTPVVARDRPGFIVNRIARPFYGEALRLLGEGVASHETIDQVVRLGGGFRMGPFELMDLIGIDVNLAAMQSMYEQSFGEPRYRPHFIQVQMVQQNTLGRKTGKGFYSYKSPTTTEKPGPPKIKKSSGQVVLMASTWGPGLSELCRQGGYILINGAATRPGNPILGIITLGRNDGLEKGISQLDRNLPPEVPILCQCSDVTLMEIATWLKRPERLVGFDGLFLTHGPLATLVASPTLTPRSRKTTESFVNSLGRVCVWIQDSPALILPRIVCMLANEAAFAASEGVGEIDTINKAMQLGTNYPKGPLAWAKEIGYAQVVAVLDHLYAEFGEERYRTAPLLRRWLRLELVSA
jgi:3-hydroxybutyryl-CoA dehydrogenase